jgi:hypothetical protein
MGSAGCSDGGSAGQRGRIIGWLNSQLAGFTENSRNPPDCGLARAVEFGSSAGLVDRLMADIVHLLTWPIDELTNRMMKHSSYYPTGQMQRRDRDEHLSLRKLALATIRA